MTTNIAFKSLSHIDGNISTTIDISEGATQMGEQLIDIQIAVRCTDNPMMDKLNTITVDRMELEALRNHINNLLDAVELEHQVIEALQED